MSRQPLTAGLLDIPPLQAAREAAARFDCDLAMGSYLGIGSLVCFTPVARALARTLGRPIRLLTGPYSHYGHDVAADPYPVWAHNPYVGEIVDGQALDPDLMWEVSRQAHNFPQPVHLIDNHLAAHGLCRSHGLPLRGDLYLSAEEKRTAMERLAHLPRPLVCLCPYGRSAPGPEFPWHRERWLDLIERLRGKVGLFAVGGWEAPKDLPVEQPITTIREMLALIGASDAYVGFDTGPSHAAAALEVPSAVLWDAVRKTAFEEAKEPGYGSAMINRWGYPQNLNVMLLGEREGEATQAILAFLAGRVFTHVF